MYQAQSQTSREAFNTLKDPQSSKEAVLSQVRARGITGTSAAWIADRLGMQTGTVAARLIELEREKQVLKLNKTMENPSGKKACIYVCYVYKNQIPVEDILATKNT